MLRKTILSVTGVDHGNGDLVAAATLAQQGDSHLNAIVIGCVPPPPISDLSGHTYSTYSFDWEREDARLKVRVAELRDHLSSQGLEGNIQPVYCLNGDVDEEVALRAAYADLTVIGKRLTEDTDMLKPVLDGVLFKSPTPVLVTGAGKVSLTPKIVLVAWNATLECGSVVRHAMDLLAQADQVHVVLIDPSATTHAMGEEPGADIANFLSRHGVKVVVDVLASGGLDPALVLQRHATDIGADLIVMGAYGHTRLRERIFGGTTRTMLANVKTPVMMAH